MSSTQEGSSGLKDKGKKPLGSRRSWTEDEEAYLIEAVKDLIAKGWKSDNGFRAGYLKKLEEAMRSHWPTTDLRGVPHIHSRLSTWKKSYHSLSTIIGQSGVGFNSDGNFKIEIEDQTWEHVLKIDGNAKGMRYKKWPYYYAWKEIYGKDRANGHMAEDIADACNDVNSKEYTEDGGIGMDYDVSLEDLGDNDGLGDSVSHTQNSTQPLPRTTSVKKRKVSDNIANLCEVVADFGKRTDARLASLVECIAYDARLGQAAEDAFQELGKIDGLSPEQRFDVCEILSANLDKVRIFRGLPESDRSIYVKRLLQNKDK